MKSPTIYRRTASMVLTAQDPAVAYDMPSEQFQSFWMGPYAVFEPGDGSNMKDAGPEHLCLALCLMADIAEDTE